MVQGQGDVWLDDVTLEPVGLDVPSTNMTAVLEQMHSHADDEPLTEKEKAEQK